MILDSSFLIDLMTGDSGAATYAEIIEETDEPQRIPAQVVYELYVGVGYTDTPVDEVEKIQAVIDSRPIIETTEQIAKRAGRIDGQLRAEGSRIPQGDVIIGATGLHYDEPVLTGDPDHFEQIEGLTVNSYREAP